jgi:hypothetical protein
MGLFVSKQTSMIRQTFLFYGRRRRVRSHTIQFKTAYIPRNKANIGTNHVFKVNTRQLVFPERLLPARANCKYYPYHDLCYPVHLGTFGHNSQPVQRHQHQLREGKHSTSSVSMFRLLGESTPTEGGHKRLDCRLSMK